MILKMMRYTIAVIGFGVGFGLGNYWCQSQEEIQLLGLHPALLQVVIPILLGLIFLLLTYMVSHFIILFGKKMASYFIDEMDKLPPHELIVGVLGLIAGLVIASLISGLFEIIPSVILANTLRITLYIFLGYLGVVIAQKNVRNDLRLKSWSKGGSPSTDHQGEESMKASPKILDTSVIIDGRIADICKTGFLEGDIIIPEFVLLELQHIADASDSLKRNRGRRGLDILKILQTDFKDRVFISKEDFSDVSEVDIKLIRLAESMNGSILTNDFNLNKVATLQNVIILNINELSNAVKPVVIPGEEMEVTIVKEGKELSQGVAYLDDGTMIVVEDGRKFVNATKHVVVTSVLQTSAGRMIFSKIKV